MKAFHCDQCGSLLFFENVHCFGCGRALGFLPEALDLSALEPLGGGLWRALAMEGQGPGFRLCQNSEQYQVCNWLVSADDSDPFCVACRLNVMIPDLSVPGNDRRWHKLELAKRRTVYTLRRLGLPTEGVPAENRPPLRFQFVGDPIGGPRALTGHKGGVITVNIAEADDEERERRRVNLREPYRTLLGHLRHEIAHYYWERLISWTPNLGRFRELFGNEETPYDPALQNYYQFGPAPNWQGQFISAYASAHPWEDWAETWAHYLHIVDTVETAASFGMTLSPDHPDAKSMTADPQQATDVDAPFDLVVKNWLPLTYALNSLNRGMGLPDLYPFVLSPQVIEKLRFIHELMQQVRERGRDARMGVPVGQGETRV